MPEFDRDNLTYHWINRHVSSFGFSFNRGNDLQIYAVFKGEDLASDAINTHPLFEPGTLACFDGYYNAIKMPVNFHVENVIIKDGMLHSSDSCTRIMLMQSGFSVVSGNPCGNCSGFLDSREALCLCNFFKAI